MTFFPDLNQGANPAGSGNMVPDTTYTASGQINPFDKFALITPGASTLAMTVANGTVSGASLLIKRQGPGQVSLSVNSDGANRTLTLGSTLGGEAINFVWNTALATWLTVGYLDPGQTVLGLASTAYNAALFLAVTDASGNTFKLPLSSLPTGTGTANSTYFQAINGNLYDTTGALFRVAGLNITPYTGYTPSYFPAVKLLYPKINFIRLVTADGWTQGGQDAATVYQFIADATAAKVVCMIDNHKTAQALSGTALSNATAWYSALATKYLSNPYVVFNTCNEPYGGSGTTDDGTIAAEQLAVYNAIRNTGNNTLVFLALKGGAETAWMSGRTATWSGMRNVGRELHIYDNYPATGTTQATVNADLAAKIAAAIAVKSADGTMPILIGQFGPSITGASNTLDPNAALVLNAVFSSGYGYLGWAWNGTSALPGGNALVSEDGLTLSTWGQQLAAKIAAN